MSCTIQQIFLDTCPEEQNAQRFMGEKNRRWRELILLPAIEMHIFITGKSPYLALRILVLLTLFDVLVEDTLIAI